MAYDVSDTPFACLDYLVIYDTRSPLGKTVLAAFHDLECAKDYLKRWIEGFGASADLEAEDYQLALVDRPHNRLIYFSYNAALALTSEQVCEVFNEGV